MGHARPLFVANIRSFQTSSQFYQEINVKIVDLVRGAGF